jgi:polysaccharide pyruvyl transferase WcaK-like protein
MEGSEDKLVRDEVFSNTEVYPVTEERSGSNGPKNILVNYRGQQNFLTDGDERQKLDHLVAYLKGLGKALDCSFTFFSVSGPPFCDDTEHIDYVREQMPDTEIHELPYTNAYDHIEAAREAYAAVSMSFHGVILSMIAGCPAIPVTHGKYYNHKYIGFGDYNPAQDIPIFYVSEPPDATFVEQSIEYCDQYDPEAVAKERRRHNEKIESYYRGILNEHNLLSREVRETVHA